MIMACQPHVDGHYYYYYNNNVCLSNLGVGGGASRGSTVGASSYSKPLNKSSSPPLKFIRQSGGGGAVVMASSGCNNNNGNNSKKMKTESFLRHVESLASFPSGAGKISRLNAVILGEALSSEENDLVLPSDDFSRQALVPSPQKVAPFSFAF